MNVLIVYAHPEPASFNAAMCARARDALASTPRDVVAGRTSGPATAHAARHSSFSPGVTRKRITVRNEGSGVRMVGVTGIEPVTPTMSTPWQLGILSDLASQKTAKGRK